MYESSERKIIISSVTQIWKSIVKTENDCFGETVISRIRLSKIKVGPTVGLHE